MARVATCSRDDCKGELKPQVDPEKYAEAIEAWKDELAEAQKKRTEEPPRPDLVITGYFCTNCGIIYETLLTIDGVPQGHNVIGRVDRHDALKAERDRYETQIAEKQAVITQITEMVEGDDSALAKAIKSVLEEPAEELQEVSA